MALLLMLLLPATAMRETRPVSWGAPGAVLSPAAAPGRFKGGRFRGGTLVTGGTGGVGSPGGVAIGGVATGGVTIGGLVTDGKVGAGAPAPPGGGPTGPPGAPVTAPPGVVVPGACAEAGRNWDRPVKEREADRTRAQALRFTCARFLSQSTKHSLPCEFVPAFFGLQSDFMF